LFLLDSIRDLSGVTKEVEVSSDSATIISTFSASTKSVVVEIITGLLESVTEAIVGIFEVEAEATVLVPELCHLDHHVHLLLIVLEGL
jgi:hypothetical protein